MRDVFQLHMDQVRNVGDVENQLLRNKSDIERHAGEQYASLHKTQYKLNNDHNDRHHHSDHRHDDHHHRNEE